MSNQPTSLVVTEQPAAEPTFEQLVRGYRWRRISQPDGTEISVQVPLTSEDFLNPQEGDVMPESVFHATVSIALYDMLKLHYKTNPSMGVFHDLIVCWGIPGLKNPAPDIAVIPNVRDRDKNRRAFNVKEEGTKPNLVIEVVSPDYRREDLVDKVDIYERASVQEYIILEQREQRGRTIDLITGYRLVDGRYRPILLEEDGRMRLQTVGLAISLENGKVMLEDLANGRRLLNAEESDAARLAAEKQAAELQDQLEAFQAELARVKAGSSST